MTKQKLKKNYIKLVCKTIENLLVDIRNLAVKYEYERRRDGISIEDFINDFWAGQDDTIYYCDNAEENQKKIIEEVQKYIKENQTQIDIEVQKIKSTLKEKGINETEIN